MLNETVNSTNLDAATEVNPNTMIPDEVSDGILEAAALEIGLWSTTTARPCNDC